MLKCTQRLSKISSSGQLPILISHIPARYRFKLYIWYEMTRVSLRFPHFTYIVYYIRYVLSLHIFFTSKIVPLRVLHFKNNKCNKAKFRFLIYITRHNYFSDLIRFDSVGVKLFEFFKSQRIVPRYDIFTYTSSEVWNGMRASNDETRMR